MLLSMTLCPLPTAAAPAQQNQPASELAAALEYWDKCVSEYKEKNLVAAEDFCRKGINAMKPIPKVRQTNAYTTLQADLKSASAKVEADRETLVNRVRSGSDLTKQKKLDDARRRLDEVKDYGKDQRFKDAESALKSHEAEYKRALEEAEKYDAAGQKKQAHFRYMDAQRLNRNATLGSEIKKTSGCYAGCKAAIWLVVLGVGGAASYVGYDQYEKNKAKTGKK